MNNSNNTTQAPIENSRSFKIVEKKNFNIPPAGTFNATVRSIAFIGTYTRSFTKSGKTTSKDYEMVGFTFNFIDLNTSSQDEIYTECVLSYVDDSRLRQYIEALGGLSEGADIKSLVGKSAKITIVHSSSDASGESKTYANISLIEPVDSGGELPAISPDHLFYFDILSDMSKIEDLNSKHKWLIQNKSHEHGSVVPQVAA